MKIACLWIHSFEDRLYEKYERLHFHEKNGKNLHSEGYGTEQTRIITI